MSASFHYSHFSLKTYIFLIFQAEFDQNYDTSLVVVLNHSFGKRGGVFSPRENITVNNVKGNHLIQSQKPIREEELKQIKVIVKREKYQAGLRSISLEQYGLAG